VQKKLVLSLAAVTLAIVGLAGCSSTPAQSGSGGGSAKVPSSASASADASGGDAALATASTTLGKVVVDGKGLTVYVFDKDTANSGKSACTGACLTAWPPVTTTSAKPAVDGVTGTVSTIATPDGKKQVTVDGLPLYTFSGDSAAGDVKGQGLMGIWWAVSADGTKVTAAASGY
jgi:predicted lipoprotein with Yx(FWY)xxD motif